MRTRSSRLFLILLHLVGVSTDLPLGGANHPLAIVLENVPLPKDGLEGLLREQDDALSQPFWLQVSSNDTMKGEGTLFELFYLTLELELLCYNAQTDTVFSLPLLPLGSCRWPLFKPRGFLTMW